MNFNRVMMIVSGVCFITIFLILFSVSGCAMYEAARDVIVGKPTTNVTPTLPKEMMWQTVKKLTPNWLAIPVIALGAVAMFNDAWKLGMSFVIFGSVNLFMALATSRFGFWMALCGLIGSMAAVVMSVLVKNKAIKEMIFGIQNVKKGFVKDGKDEIAVRITNAQSNIQARSTKKIVAAIKNKAKLIGEM